MDERARELFKAERERLGLNQTQVAERGGVKQSTISKIEIEPTYQPSVDSFAKALKGIHHTLSSFFLQIEALRTATNLTDDTRPDEPSDETDAALLQRLTEELSAAHNVVGTLSRLIGRAEEATAARHRQAASADLAAAKRAKDRHKSAQRLAQPKATGRSVGKGR